MTNTLKPTTWMDLQIFVSWRFISFVVVAITSFLNAIPSSQDNNWRTTDDFRNSLSNVQVKYKYKVKINTKFSAQTVHSNSPDSVKTEKKPFSKVYHAISVSKLTINKFYRMNFAQNGHLKMQCFNYALEMEVCMKCDAKW